MAGVTSPERSFEIANALLTAISDADKLRKADMLARQASLVDSLGVSSESWSDERPVVSVAPEAEAPVRRRTLMPKRTTHGGGFGPQVRAKIARQAMERGDQW